MPDYTLSELIALAADAVRYEHLKALCEHAQINQQDIASNGWNGSANPNTFDSHRYVLTTGTSTAYVATFATAFSSLSDGCMLKVDFHTDCGNSPTLNLDTLGAKAIVKPDGSNVASGELKQGYVIPCIYSAAIDKWVVVGLAPSTQSAPTVQKFTSNDTWNRPAGCRAAIVEVQGAGGGGGGDAGSADCGGGGGGGYVRKLIDVTSIATSTVVVGSGGAGGSAGNGSAGGNSSWSDGTNTLSGSGGSGGVGSDQGAGGDGGAATGGDINVPGAPGNFGSNEGGHGGGSFMSPGAWRKTTGTLAGQDAIGPGGGGSGCRDGGGDGGDGGDGMVIVTEFY